MLYPNMKGPFGSPIGPTLGGIPYGRGGYTPGPAGIGGLVAWYDASQLGLNDNDAVASWTDLSVNGHHAVQATAAKKPLFKTAIQNGLPVVRFDGTDDLLISDLFTFSQPLTVAVAVSVSDVTSPRNILDGGNAVNTRVIQANTATVHRLFAGSIADVTVSAQTAFFAVIDSFSGTASIVNFNGTETVVSPGTANGTGISIGASPTPASFAPCDIAEIILYNSVLSKSQRTSLMSYLKTKYAIA